jgi:2-phospho-L-lactate guanylyltransferase
MRVIDAAHPFEVNVVCDDEEVAEFATRAGARVIWCPERGLNPAVKEGVETLRDRGVTEVVVSHADLPFATSFSHLTGWPGVTLVPDRHRRGTNVAVVPTSASFQWAYGSGSLGRHRSETIRLGLPLRIVRSDELAWDIDIPDDLREGPAGVSAAALLPSPS